MMGLGDIALSDNSSKKGVAKSKSCCFAKSSYRRWK